MRALILMWLVLIANVGIASAHSRLIRSEPAQGATAQDVDTIVLEFDAPVERKFATLRLVLADKTSRDLEVTGSGAARRIEIAVGNLPAGEYALQWSVVSSDGHRIRGTLRFSIAR